MADKSKDFEELKKLNKELGKGADLSKIRKDAEAVKLLLESWRKEADSVANSVTDLSKQMRNVIDDLTKSSTEVKNINKAFRTTEDIVSDLRNDTEGITQLNRKDLETMEEKLNKAAATMNFERQQLLEKSKLVKLTDKETAQLNELQSLFEENGKLREDENNYLIQSIRLTQQRLEFEKQVEKRMGIAGGLMKGLSTTLDKFGMGGLLQMDKISEKMEDVAREGGSRFKVLGAGLTEAFKSLKTTLTDPVAMITGIFGMLKGIVSFALKYRDLQFETGKALGIGVTEAGKLRSEFRQIAQANNDLGLTAGQLVETYSGLNDQLGFMGPRNAEFLTTTAGIQRRIGASAEQMERLQAFAMGSHKSLQGAYASVINSAKAMGARLKLNMSEKQILDGISKVSAGVLLNMKGNVPALAAAVVQAKKFGTTLDEIASQGEQMLDFESSMQKQMEFQLLTGKEIDLSNARELAMNNDTVGLMKELNRLGMSQGEYEKMNFFQRQSYAEMLGLSKDKLEEIYHQQSLTNELGKEAGEQLKAEYDAKGNLIGQQSAADALKASAQEKMTAAIENMKEKLGEMLLPVAKLAEQFLGWITNMDNLKLVLGGILALMTAIGVRAMFIGGQKKQQLATDLQMRALNTQMIAQSAVIQAKATGQVVSQELAAAAAGKTAVMQAANAGSSAAAGAGYLGPGALAVGLAVVGGLMMMISSMGGPSKKPSAQSISASVPTAMSKPMNAAAASAETAKQISAPDANKSTNVKINLYQDPVTGTTIKSTINSDGRASYDVTKNINPAQNK
jgi:hypothetical protein